MKKTVLVVFWTKEVWSTQTNEQNASFHSTPDCFPSPLVAQTLMICKHFWTRFWLSLAFAAFNGNTSTWTTVYSGAMKQISAKYTDKMYTGRGPRRSWDLRMQRLPGPTSSTNVASLCGEPQKGRR